MKKKENDVANETLVARNVGEVIAKPKYFGETTQSREKQGIITGIVGLCCNLVLGISKLVAGIITGNVAIASDAANNLSDAGNSLVTVASFFLGGRKADREHPYGHGRYEYIASLIIGIVILFVGIQFAMTSLDKIIHPTQSVFSWVAMSVLIASIAVKMFMGFFYIIRSKKIGSDTLKAASLDSFSDCLITLVVIIGLVVGLFVPFVIDGYLGLVVSCVIFYGGIKVLHSTITRLLGGRCSHEMEEKITQLALSGSAIVGVHDLKVHDYGPNMAVASIHAEFDKDLSMSVAHAIIDDIEHRAHHELNVELVVHCDPIDTSDLTKNRIRHAIKDILRYYESSLHDLKIDYEEETISFHVELAARYFKQEEYIKECLIKAINEIKSDFVIEIEVDVNYD